MIKYEVIIEGAPVDNFRGKLDATWLKFCHIMSTFRVNKTINVTIKSVRGMNNTGLLQIH